MLSTGRSDALRLIMSVSDCSWRFPRTQIRQLCEKRQLFTDEDIAFQEKIAYRTGLGDDTAVCPAIQSGDASHLGIEAARFEFGATCFTTIQELFNKTGLRPKDIDIVITNSSLFNPTPSLSAAILNHFKMSSKTVNYSLGGMGCSAGLFFAISICCEVHIRTGVRLHRQCFLQLTDIDHIALSIMALIMERSCCVVVWPRITWLA